MDQCAKSDDELAKKVLLHLYTSIVVGTLKSTAGILRMKLANHTMNPRYKDLRALYDSLGESGRRLFYDSVAAIAEFSVFSTLDFVETYNRFDSEDKRNDDEYPRLDFVYSDATGERVAHYTLSKFGSVQLGMLFKQIARAEDLRRS